MIARRRMERSDRPQRSSTDSTRAASVRKPLLMHQQVRKFTDCVAGRPKGTLKNGAKTSANRVGVVIDRNQQSQRNDRVDTRRVGRTEKCGPNDSPAFQC